MTVPEIKRLAAMNREDFVPYPVTHTLSANSILNADAGHGLNETRVGVKITF